MRYKLSILLLVCVAVFGLSGCKETPAYDACLAEPDYSLPETWFEGGCADGKLYDVFYIVPTCVFDWTDTVGDTCHYMDVYNESHHQSVDAPLRLAKGIFADDANFYAPYYRQITIESWAECEDTIETRFQLAFKDIRNAFKYYMQYLNGGRPFILAGHSQGGKAVIELLKHEMCDEWYGRMIAAYPLGYPVREHDASPYLVPAFDAYSTGVFITFSSVSSPDRLSPLLSGSLYAINPLNWRVDSVYATKDEHLGSVFIAEDGNVVAEYPYLISAYIDNTTNALVVSGIEPDDYYVPELSALFPVGNYHAVELNFFYRNLQQNVKERVRTFLQQ